MTREALFFLFFPFLFLPTPPSGQDPQHPAPRLSSPEAEATQGTGLRVTRVPASATGRPLAQLPSLQSKEEPGASGHKNRILERLDFPFLTVDLLRKRHLNKTFFFLCVFQNTLNGGKRGAKLLRREDFSAPDSLDSPNRLSCPFPPIAFLLALHPPTPAMLPTLLCMPLHPQTLKAPHPFHCGVYN